ASGTCSPKIRQGQKLLCNVGPTGFKAQVALEAVKGDRTVVASASAAGFLPTCASILRSSFRALRGSPRPSLVVQHHLSPDATGEPVSGHHHGLVHAQAFGLAHLEYRAMDCYGFEAGARDHHAQKTFYRISRVM